MNVQQLQAGNLRGPSAGPATRIARSAGPPVHRRSDLCGSRCRCPEATFQQAGRFTFDILGQAVASGAEPPRYHEALSRAGAEDLAPASTPEEIHLLDRDSRGSFPPANIYDDQADPRQPFRSHRSGRLPAAWRRAPRLFAQRRHRHRRLRHRSYRPRTSLAIFRCCSSTARVRDFSGVGIVIMFLFATACGSDHDPRLGPQPQAGRLGPTGERRCWDYERSPTARADPSPSMSKVTAPTPDFERVGACGYPRHQECPASRDRQSQRCRSLAYGLAVAGDSCPRGQVQDALRHRREPRSRAAQQRYRVHIYMPYQIVRMAIPGRRFSRTPPTTGPTAAQREEADGDHLPVQIHSDEERPRRGDLRCRVRCRRHPAGIQVVAAIGTDEADDEQQIAQPPRSARQRFHNERLTDLPPKQTVPRYSTPLHQVADRFGEYQLVIVAGRGPMNRSARSTSNFPKTMGSVGRERVSTALAARRRAEPLPSGSPRVPARACSAARRP